jgi:hypothetical protein
MARLVNGRLWMGRSVIRDGKIIRPARLTKGETAHSRCISPGKSQEAAKVRKWRTAELHAGGFRRLADGRGAGEVLRPAPDGALQGWAVSTRVNRSGTADDDPSLIRALDETT